MKKNLYSILAFLFALLGFFSFIGQSFAWSGETTNLEAYYNFNGNINDSSIRWRDLEVLTGTVVYASWATSTGGDFWFALACNGSFVVHLPLGEYLPSSWLSWYTISFWKKNVTNTNLLWLWPVIYRSWKDYFPIVWDSTSNQQSLKFYWSTVAALRGAWLIPVNTWDLHTFKVSNTYTKTTECRNDVCGLWGVHNYKPLWYGDRLMLCWTTNWGTSDTSDYLIWSWYIDDFRFYSRFLSDAEVAAMYTWWQYIPPPTDVDWLCGYALWFTWFFATWDACLVGTFTWLNTLDINWYTWYTYTCAGLWSGTNDSCYTAQQTTGACWTMQWQTFYEDIENYSNQYTYCSGGNDLMTWLTYLEWNYWDWYCNWPTEFWPQAYCSAYPFIQSTSICWSAHLQTFIDDTLLTGWYLCANWDDGGILFHDDYWRTWGCYIENSISSDTSCVAYLSWGLGFVSPNYTGDNPFEAIDYTENLTWQQQLQLWYLRNKLSFFNFIRTFFTTYFVFVPQDTTTFNIYIPWYVGNWIFWSVALDIWAADEPLYASKDCSYDSCVYTTGLWNKISIPNNTFRSLTNVLLPVLFAIIYIGCVILLLLVLLFLPIYLIYPVLNNLKEAVMHWLHSANTNVAWFTAWVFYATVVYWSSFVLYNLYASAVAPFVDEFKATLWYILVYSLKVFFIDSTYLRHTVIIFNAAVLSILVSFVFYWIVRYAVKL